MDEYVLPAFLRLYEAKALLDVEKLDCTCSHIRPPLKTPIGLLHDIVQSCVRIQRCLRRAHVGKRQGQAKSRTMSYMGYLGCDINPIIRRFHDIQAKLQQGTIMNETGRCARSDEKLRKNVEKTAQRKAERSSSRSSSG